MVCIIPHFSKNAIGVQVLILKLELSLCPNQKPAKYTGQYQTLFPLPFQYVAYSSALFENQYIHFVDKNVLFPHNATCIGILVFPIRFNKRKLVKINFDKHVFFPSYFVLFIVLVARFCDLAD